MRSLKARPWPGHSQKVTYVEYRTKVRLLSPLSVFGRVARGSTSVSGSAIGYLNTGTPCCESNVSPSALPPTALNIANQKSAPQPSQSFLGSAADILDCHELAYAHEYLINDTVGVF